MYGSCMVDVWFRYGSGLVEVGRPLREAQLVLYCKILASHRSSKNMPVPDGRVAINR